MFMNHPGLYNLTAFRDFRTTGDPEEERISKGSNVLGSLMVAVGGASKECKSKI